jgi:His/Glu/Gln/Arg/opine family amino acid ABC transporter permease subunit
MDWDLVRESFPLIWKGAGMTIRLFLWSLAIGTAAAIVLALMRLSSAWPLRWFAAIFGWLFRGIPLLILLFYAFFALPELAVGNIDGITLPAFWAAVVGLSLWTAAYQAETIRSGIIAVDPGQAEAAEALGMTKRHYMRRIILPQGVRIMIPPYMSIAMTLLKQTSLATLVTVPEMTLLTQRIFSNNFQFIEPIFALAVLYLAMTTVLLGVQQLLERAFRLKV